jgi:4-diphosphocytidyl-2-C-methyl-D-erythritol kinase
MLIERIPDGWAITVPSKLNLFLEVVGRRPDGFHDLDTVMLAVSLCDQLHIRRVPDASIRLRMQPLTGHGFEKLHEQDQAWDIPTDHRNLVVKALEAVRNRLGIVEGLEVDLMKGIPSQAGLGGGSADAAAAIIGGMLAWTNRYNEQDAKQLAAKLGSDINFFLEGNAGKSKLNNWLARCTGRGEFVEPIESNQRMHFVVLHPPIGCSTQKVFSRIASGLGIPFASRDSREILSALKLEDGEKIPKLLFNRLSNAASQDTVWIAGLLEALRSESQVLGCEMTGSGSAVFGIVKNFAEAESTAKSFRERLKVRAYAVSTWQAPTISDQLEGNDCR